MSNADSHQQDLHNKDHQPYNINHPDCILKVTLYASKTFDDAFKYAQVDPTWYDAVEPHTIASMTKKRDIRRLPISFLSRNKAPEVFDAEPFWNITYISLGFMNSSSTLKKLDLSNAFQNVTLISDAFLFYATALEKLDLSGLKKVTAVGDRFCADLHNLTDLKIDLPSLEKTGAKFFSGSKKLKSFDVSSLKSLKKVASYFLADSGIESLEGADAAWAGSIEKVGPHFLADCAALKSINIAFLASPKLESIGSHFLYRASALTTVTGAAAAAQGAPQLAQVGEQFFGECSKLTAAGLDVPSFKTFEGKVAAKAKNFLKGCAALEQDQAFKAAFFTAGEGAVATDAAK